MVKIIETDLYCIVEVESADEKEALETAVNLVQASGRLSEDDDDSGRVLARLLWPLRPARFFARIWEQRALIIRRRCPTFYRGGQVAAAASSAGKPGSSSASLFSKRQFEQAVTRHKLQFGVHFNAMRYDKEGRRINFGKHGVSPTSAELRALWDKERVTFQVMQPQQFTPLCHLLNHALEQKFGCLVGNNAYITPGGTQGLAPHWDDIEVIALQLEGCKRWRLYEPGSPLQREYSPDFDQDEIGEPFLDITLFPGDLMYFTRGTIHQAVAVDPSDQAAAVTAAKAQGTPLAPYSHHLTVSTYQKHAWVDFLSLAIQDALDAATDDDVEFRRGLPIAFLNYMGAAHSDLDLAPPEARDKLEKKRTEFVNQARLLFATLAEELDLDATADSMGSDFVAHRLPPPRSCGGPVKAHQWRQHAESDEDGATGESQLANAADRAMADAIDADCSVRLRVHPSHLRLVMEMVAADDSEENDSSDDSDTEESEDTKATQCTIVYSLQNRVDRNMDGRFEGKPGVLRFPGRYSVAMAALICQYPKTISLQELPMLGTKDRIVMAKALCCSGLLTVNPSPALTSSSASSSNQAATRTKKKKSKARDSTTTSNPAPSKKKKTLLKK